MLKNVTRLITSHKIKMINIYFFITFINGQEPVPARNGQEPVPARNGQEPVPARSHAKKRYAIKNHKIKMISIYYFHYIHNRQEPVPARNGQEPVPARPRAKKRYTMKYHR